MTDIFVNKEQSRLLKRVIWSNCSSFDRICTADLVNATLVPIRESVMYIPSKPDVPIYFIDGLDVNLKTGDLTIDGKPLNIHNFIELKISSADRRVYNQK